MGMYLANHYLSRHHLVPHHKLTLRLSSSATDEADRLAENFENIDGWVGSVDKMSAGVIINRAIDKRTIGRNVSKEFYSIMYDGYDEILPFGMDGHPVFYR